MHNTMDIFFIFNISYTFTEISEIFAGKFSVAAADLPVSSQCDDVTVYVLLTSRVECLYNPDVR